MIVRESALGALGCSQFLEKHRTQNAILRSLVVTKINYRKMISKARRVQNGAASDFTSKREGSTVLNAIGYREGVP